MSDNDRELLELAAEAMEFGAFTWTEDEYPKGSNKYGALWNYVGFMDSAELWNPLTSDGDALRLATKLFMSVDIDQYERSTYAYAGEIPRVFAKENWLGDMHAATRRAIVRAAAAVTKSKHAKADILGETYGYHQIADDRV